jgi:EmrB/QacA subfamily drug resistance transporter
MNLVTGVPGDEPLDLRTSSARGRWVIAASVLGSGVAFLDGSVVNAALPAIANDLDADLAGIQWVLSAYLLTLGSLVVIGGALGDRFGRKRVFLVGLAAFALTSLLCGSAPTIGLLVVARALQGVAAALLVPGSLAIVSSSFHPDDRGRAIGAWSGLAGVSTALGPFVGGWLIDAVSWRAVFLVNLPLVAAAMYVTVRHVPESRDPTVVGSIDFVGGALLAVGLAGVVYALIEGPSADWPPMVTAVGIAGALALVAFVLVELRLEHPMVPLGVFRSWQFSGANLATFGVYAGLGATLFLLTVHLQEDLGYSALEAGAAFLPATALMLAFSARSGAVAQRIGPRWPMTIGPFVVALGMVWLSQVAPGSSYVNDVLPGVLVMGVGLTITVAPLTTAVLASVEDAHAGIASAINNAVARIAGLLAIAVIPAAAGLAGQGLSWNDGYDVALEMSAAVTATAGVVSWLTIRKARPVRPVAHPGPFVACQDRGVLEPVLGPRPS